MPSGAGSKPSFAAREGPAGHIRRRRMWRRLLAAGYLRLPEEIRGHWSLQFPHEADWPVALVRDVVCGADERVGHRAPVLLLSRTHEEEDMAATVPVMNVERKSEFAEHLESVRARFKMKRNFIKLIDRAKWS